MQFLTDKLIVFPSALKTTNFHRPPSFFTDFQSLEKLIPFFPNFQRLCEPGLMTQRLTAVSDSPACPASADQCEGEPAIQVWQRLPAAVQPTTPPSGQVLEVKVPHWQHLCSHSLAVLPVLYDPVHCLCSHSLAVLPVLYDPVHLFL